jgi:hypothetical protein
MTKRLKQVDVLREIRRALRALRRAEISIVVTERAERRRLIAARDTAELERLAAEHRAQAPSALDLIRGEGGAS